MQEIRISPCVNLVHLATLSNVCRLLPLDLVLLHYFLLRRRPRLPLHLSFPSQLCTSWKMSAFASRLLGIFTSSAGLCLCSPGGAGNLIRTLREDVHSSRSCIAPLSFPLSAHLVSSRPRSLEINIGASSPPISLSALRHHATRPRHALVAFKAALGNIFRIFRPAAWRAVIQFLNATEDSEHGVK